MLTLLHYPVMRIYSKYDYYSSPDASLSSAVVEQEREEASEPSSNLNSITLGNMGFSKTECIILTMVPGNQANLKCNSGRMTQLIDFGVTTHFED